MNIKFRLPCYGIVVDVDDDIKMGASGTIISDLHENYSEDDPEKADIIEYNTMVNGIESMILAHACAGIDISTPAYIEGIETAIDACAQQTS